jgi:hypothetical protein
MAIYQWGTSPWSLSNATPATVGTAAAGTSVFASRGDHVHAHGNQAGGTLHAEATTSVAGFLSRDDKAKLDGLASIASSGSATHLTTGIIPDARMPDLTGDVTTSEGAVATTIASNAVTNAKLADMTSARIKGRTSAGSGDPEDLTGTQATALLDVFSSTLKGLAPASGGGTSSFLRADATWAPGPVTVITLAADRSSTSTTGAEVGGIDAPSLAAGTYVFQYFLRCQTAATTTGIKFGVNFTGTNSVFVAAMRHLTTGTTAASGISQGASSAAQLVEGYATRTEQTTAPNLGPTVGVDTASADVLVFIEGILVATGSGDLELWHASEVAGSAATVKAGSCLILTKAA